MKKMLFLLLTISILQSCKKTKRSFSIVKYVEFSLNEKGEPIGYGDTVAIEYYSKGVLKKKIMYDSVYGKRRTKKEVEYSSNGKEATYSFEIEHTLANKTEIERDSNGNIAMMKMYELNSTDTSILLYKNMYKKGNFILQSEVWDNTSNSLKMVLDYEYDSNDRIISMRTLTVTDAARVLQSVEKYAYDSKGNKVQEIVENPVEGSVRKRVYKYGSENNILNEALFDGAQLVYEITYCYEGGMKKEAVYTSGLKKKKIIFKYE
jgi:hypothetical protein